LPESFCELKKLEYLSLDNTKLTSLPESVCEFKNLVYLYLSNTQLTSLPESICELKKLEYLDLYKTNIFVNKKNRQLIDFLDKHKASYTLVEDTLLTDILI
jgi:Leucine-rich repeat (LRR) protein